jgi:hypothetical protein
MPEEHPASDPAILPGDIEFYRNKATIPLPAVTTAQQDLTFAGQRRINLVWEYTQAIIALIVVAATMAAGIYSAFSQKTEQVPTIMSVAFGTVVGFYFSRTNHAAIGGVGQQPREDPYKGR